MCKGSSSMCNTPQFPGTQRGASLAGHLSKAADVFAAGVLLWELWAGCGAWSGMNQVSPDFWHAPCFKAGRLFRGRCWDAGRLWSVAGSTHAMHP